jgi:hypothetical protein
MLNWLNLNLKAYITYSYITIVTIMLPFVIFNAPDIQCACTNICKNVLETVIELDTVNTGIYACTI